jgi:hypothetical protein
MSLLPQPLSTFFVAAFYCSPHSLSFLEADEFLSPTEEMLFKAAEPGLWGAVTLLVLLPAPKLLF